MGFAEAMHESGVVITSSPGADAEGEERHVERGGAGVGGHGVPVPHSRAKAASSSRTSAPWVIQPLSDRVDGLDLGGADVRPGHRNAPVRPCARTPSEGGSAVVPNLPSSSDRARKPPPKRNLP